MKKDIFDFDIKLVSQIFVLVIIAIIIGYLFFGMFQITKRNKSEQTSKIEQVIRKGLVQCYALEGSYPADVHYLEKYGVIFEDNKFIYQYDIFGTNFSPEIKVVEK